MVEFKDVGGDVGRLRLWYRSDSNFRALLDCVAKPNSKFVGWLDVGDIAKKMGASAPGRSEIIRICKALRDLKCAWFKVGRRKFPTRLEFRVNPRELLELASAKETPEAALPTATMLSHRFRLRPNLEISFELPGDLRSKEVARLTEFLKTIPFE
jgi:hypothetical protein